MQSWRDSAQRLEPDVFTESIGTVLLKMVVGVLCTSELNCAAELLSGESWHALCLF